MRNWFKPLLPNNLCHYSLDALDAAGAGSNMAQTAVAEILKTAQRDELSSLPRDKHAPRGYSPAQLRATLQFEVPGIVQLGATQYLAKLEVGLTVGRCRLNQVDP